jgi:ribosomally synthesized peptide (two-chain TOMM family)
MYSNPFPELRAAYLRSIARAWRDPEFYKRLIDSKDEKEGALAILRREFGMEFPWAVKLVIAAGDPGPAWQPGNTRGWIGTEDAFTLYLPVEDKPPANPAELLARYYQERPSPLGRQAKGVAEDWIPSAFAEFGAVTIRALALAWNDATFKELLLSANGKPRAANKTFQDYLDYHIPWNFSVYFKAHAYPKTDEDWEAFPPNEIKLVLPQRPGGRDPMVEAVALAAYNGTGPQYPFTCG